jgi:plastocyanin
MSRKTYLACASLLAVFALGGCGGNDDSGNASQAEESPSATTESGETRTPTGSDAVRAAKVEIVDFTYDPDPVTIQAGGKVIWINRDSEPHTATAEDGSFDTGTLEEGKLKSESFKEPGTHAYTCSIHPSMRGALEVVE